MRRREFITLIASALVGGRPLAAHAQAQTAKLPIICKIWYSTMQTVSDLSTHPDCSTVARYAHSPSSPAPSARRFAAVGLDRSARPSKLRCRHVKCAFVMP